MGNLQDHNGRKYKLRDNVEQMFTKFVHEGKSTIRFKEPSHDVSISKADKVQLKVSLSVLRLGSTGEDIGGTMLSSLAPVSSKQVACPKTKNDGYLKTFGLSDNRKLSILLLLYCRL